MNPNSGPGTGRPPLISLSIVSHGDGRELSLLLESLASHEPADQLQLLVTDNLGCDLPEMRPSGWHSLVMFRPSRPRGFASNHNAAYESATGPYFCVLNPDVLFTGGVFLRLVEHLDRGEGDIAAPLLEDSQCRIQDSFRSLPSPWELVRRRVGRNDFTSAPPMEVLLHPDWIAGTFMLMRSGTFSRLGGFDSRYRLYFEDVDFCTRARLMGLTILVDGRQRVRHDPRRASRRAGEHLLWHIQSALRFFSSGVYRRARTLKSRV